MNPQCSVALLESALARSLSAEDEAAFERHLEECDACSVALEQMAGGTEWCREAAALLAEDELDAAVPTRDEWSEVDFTVEHLEPADEPNVLGRLGGYDVLEIIGHGGMGVVLKGFDRELKRSVAIKVLAPHLARSSLARKRFAREAQAAAAVVHPHVLAIHQVQPGGRLPFLVMPLVAGESLAERLTAQGTLELKEILRIGMQAAAGLAAAHEQGLVHRDVKPANILLEKGVERAVLTDFGLACAADDVTLTRWGTIAGTPQYMSPEQARGKPLDGRSDLFSLGCVLYEMATGVSPFRADSIMATMRRLVDDPPQAMASLNPELPPWFIAIVGRLLEKDPARRFNSAQEVSQLLEGCLAHVQQPANVPLPAGLPKPASRRGWQSTPNIKGVLTMIGTLGIGLLGVLLATANPPDIEGEWTGEDWGTVALKKISDTEYAGMYTDTFGKKPGEIHLKWSRIERRFYGTWREGQALAFSADGKTLAQSTDRFGELSVRLVSDEIRGALTTDAKSAINPATPRLADLTWRRVKLSKSFTLRFEEVEAAPALPYPLDNISGKIEMRVGSPDDRADQFLMIPGTMQTAGEISHVWAETSGTVKEVLVEPGQHVNQGQAIVKLDSPLVQDQLETNQDLVKQLQSRLASIKASPRQPAKEVVAIARVEFEKAQALAEFARLEAKRFAKLKDANAAVVTEIEIANAHATLVAREADEKIAKARLDALVEQPSQYQKELEDTEKQLQVAKEQLAESRQLLEACTVRVPADGIVFSLRAAPGQLIRSRSTPGASEICQITDMAAVEIRVQVAPDDASQIDPGEDIEVQFDHQGTTVRWRGHIVSPDPEHIGNPVVVRIANLDWRLYRAGATVTLRFKLRAAKGASQQGAKGTPHGDLGNLNLFARPATSVLELRKLMESQGLLADSRREDAQILLARITELFAEYEKLTALVGKDHPKVPELQSQIHAAVITLLRLSRVEGEADVPRPDTDDGAKAQTDTSHSTPAPGRIAIVQEIERQTRARYLDHQASLQQVLQAKWEVYTAERDLGTTNEKRMTTLKYALAAAQDFENVVHERMKAGEAPPRDVWGAHRYRLAIRQALNELQGQKQDRDAGGAARLAQLKEIEQQTEAKYLKQVASLPEVLQAKWDVYTAQYDACTTDEERKAALKSMLAAAQEIENIVREQSVKTGKPSARDDWWTHSYVVMAQDALAESSSSGLGSPKPGASSAAVLELAISELQHAEVYVQQQKANLQFAKADLMRAGAKLSRSQGEGEEIETSYQELLKKYEQKLVEKRLVDKSTQQRNAAQAAEQTARAEFNAAQAKHEAAKDRLRRAEAELQAAQQKVQAATAQSGGGSGPHPASGARLDREGETRETPSTRSGSSSLGPGSSSVSNPPASDKHALPIAEAELEKAQATVESARANAARMAKLAEMQAVDPRLVDEAEARVRMAQADEKAAKARRDAVLTPESEKLALVIARAELEKAQAVARLARMMATRLKELYEANSVTQEIVIKAEVDLRKAEAEEKVAQARLDYLLERSGREEKASGESSVGQPVPVDKAKRNY